MAQTYNLLTSILLTLLLNPLILVVANEPHGEHNSSYEPPSEARKIGPHQPESLVNTHHNEPSISPTQAPNSDHHVKKMVHENVTHHAMGPSHSETTSHDEHQTSNPKVHLEATPTHHHVDKSVAGGGVIIGGLAMAFIIAIFCYIRATRRTRQRILSKEELI